MIRGSCLCGDVAFHVSGDVMEMGNCHCSECRKAYGAAFGTVAVVEKERFKYLSGEELIRSFAQSERVNRYFCSKCGVSRQQNSDIWTP